MKFQFSSSKKHLHINVKCDRACSEFQERAELSVADSRTPELGVILATNTFTSGGKAAALQYKCKDDRSDPNAAPRCTDSCTALPP